MRSHRLSQSPVARPALAVVALLALLCQARAQSTASIEGQITDPNHAALAGVEIKARNLATGIERTAVSDSRGIYQIAALPVGDYRLEVTAAGFQPLVVGSVRAEVGRIIAQDFELQVGSINQELTVSAAASQIDRTTISVGHVRLNETHTFGASIVNEARFGFNRIYGLDEPIAKLNPADFGILDGITEPIGLPQLNVAGGSLNFGGPATFPSGRGDTTFVVADTLSWLSGLHALKLGGEFRQFLNNNIRRGTGTFNFPTVPAFLSGTANSFSITLGDQSSSIAQGALGFFVQDNYMAPGAVSRGVLRRFEPRKLRPARQPCRQSGIWSNNRHPLPDG
jgi:hypothetical protein